MKERQVHAGPFAGCNDLLLRAIQRPVGAQTARILGGIGVANHHFLAFVDARAIPRKREQLGHDRACALEIAAGLEQRHDALRMVRPCRHLQELDGEDV